jgi:hypothetical protein
MDETGRRLPLQADVLDRWPDGSLRWVLLDFQVSTESPTTSLALAVSSRRDDERPQDEPATPRIALRHGNGTVSIDTGPAQFEFDQSAGWFSSALVDGHAQIDGRRSGMEIVDAHGRVYWPQIANIASVDAGRLRASVEVDGVFAAPGRPALLSFTMRLQFFAGLSVVRHDVTLRNPRRAAHPGGFWELGDPGSVFLKDARFFVAAPVDCRNVVVAVSPEPDAAALRSDGGFELYQDSSGGEHWDSSNHVNAAGRISTSFRGYTLTTSTETQTGLRATPIASIDHDTGGISVAVEYFWQNFPKAIEGAPDGIRFRMFPKQSGEAHEIQGGEQKTHSFAVAFGSDGVTASPLEWYRQPAHVSADPRWYCSTQAIPFLTPAAEDGNTEYLALASVAVEGAHSFESRRDIIDEYGWRNFGDLYADHEAAFQTPGEPPFVSHYNNQYDAIAGFGYHFLRTGDWRWRTAMDQLAAHVVDIDIYHTDEDKAAYNHGLFWHTTHYVDAGKATHRSFPRPSGHGGGPSPEHNYTTGLLLHYFLTGERRSRSAALGLAKWVIAIDDGQRTPFRWLASGPTGMVSVIGTMSDHGPGRGPGNSVNALVDGHRLSGDRVFLAKAEEIIRRCIHPADDIDSRNLLDAERRWSYTVFLQALGKYLVWKRETGELDYMYAYARETLLRYARWMAAHERPYLEHREQLEFPTETWAAQDMRKSDIFKLASMHTAGDERVRFLERGDFFFDYSVRTLRGMPTHVLTRPVVLLLTNGLMHSYFQRRTDVSAPPAAIVVDDFGSPERFVPQRLRARRHAIWIAVSGLAAGVCGLALYCL